MTHPLTITDQDALLTLTGVDTALDSQSLEARLSTALQLAADRVSVMEVINNNINNNGIKTNDVAQHT